MPGANTYLFCSVPLFKCADSVCIRMYVQRRDCNSVCVFVHVGAGVRAGTSVYACVCVYLNLFDGWCVFVCIHTYTNI